MTTQDRPAEGLAHNPEFRSYLWASAYAGMALAMQQLLLSWLLIGVLKLPADQVGLIQAIIGIPGLALMLAGGASADRRDARSLLIWLYLVAPVFPIALIFAEQWYGLNVLWVMIWGLGISVVQSYSMPGQQAIMNRIAGDKVQQGVTAATAIGFVVQVVGLTLAGLIDSLGIAPVLICQAIALALAGFMTSRISVSRTPPTPTSVSAWQGIKEGLAATGEHPVIFQVLTINFVSSIFNAGSFFTVFPFIVKRVYDGDAWLLAVLMAVFFIGGALSNIVLLRFQPLRRPGQLFLVMQLSRMVVLWLMWIEPGFWLMVLATVGWGLNMGVTSNLARSIVQESAPKPFLGRILAVFSISMVGSAPIGAVVLGWIIERFGTLNALLPAMLLSVALFIYGVFFSKVWGYESKSD